MVSISLAFLLLLPLGDWVTRYVITTQPYRPNISVYMNRYKNGAVLTQPGHDFQARQADLRTSDFLLKTNVTILGSLVSMPRKENATTFATLSPDSRTDNEGSSTLSSEIHSRDSLLSTKYVRYDSTGAGFAMQSSQAQSTDDGRWSQTSRSTSPDYDDWSTTSKYLQPILDVVFDSRFKGYIQTSGWDQREYYTGLYDNCVILTAPRRHVVMTTVLTIDRRDVTYSYLADGGCFGKIFANYSRTQQSPTFLSRSRIIAVNVVSEYNHWYKMPRKRFKLLFSYHNRSASPRQLPSGKWNCSSPYWADFQQHFLCTPEQQCDAGEDDVICPWKASWLKMCGTGHVSATKCISYIRREVRWIEAARECASRNLQMLKADTIGSRVQDFVLILGLTTYQLEWAYYLVFFKPSFPSELMYRGFWKWPNGTIAYGTPMLGFHGQMCAGYKLRPTYARTTAVCSFHAVSILCETDEKDLEEINLQPEVIQMQLPSTTANVSVDVITCPTNHSTRSFLACDVYSDCWLKQNGDCPAPLTPLPPSFECTNQIERVPYTLLCDHREDCSDGSDEDFCVFPPCNNWKYFPCDKKQCIPSDDQCNGVEDCVDKSDEAFCQPGELHKNEITPPGVITFTGKSSFTFTTLAPNATCPETHFRCPGNGFCLPVYVRCNDVYDCPGKEDEAACDSYTCPGFYRCRKSRVCLHPEHLCDGILQCPQRDDELLCDVTCPTNCTCFGLAFTCGVKFRVADYPELRYLDAGGSGMKDVDVAANALIVHLSLARCDLSSMGDLHLPNLRSLDLSDNHLISLNIHHIVHLKNLRSLRLARNPITSLFSGADTSSLSSLLLRFLDLSGVPLKQLSVTKFVIPPMIQTLNLTMTGLEGTGDDGFQALTKLRVLDLRGCPMTEFGLELVFDGLTRLETVYASSYRLCCSSVLPERFNVKDCHAPSPDDVSSCNDLLGSDIVRVSVSVFTFLALLGNFCKFIAHVIMMKHGNKTGFGTFMMHLSLSDFLMGVYLAVIGVADRLYQGNYVWQDTTWMDSAACKAAGFLSLVSNEVSAFALFFLTLDRFLAVRLPSYHAVFERRSAYVVYVAWAVGVCVAIAPFFDAASDWRLYSKTATCLPLPVTDPSHPGHVFTHGLVVLHLILAGLVLVGQIFFSLTSPSSIWLVMDTSRRSEDWKLARRIFTISLSNVLCFLPASVAVLTRSAQRATVSYSALASVAIFVLPFNAALNPYLYILSVVMERRRDERIQMLKHRLVTNIKSTAKERSGRGNVAGVLPEGPPRTKPEAWRCFQGWLDSGLISRDRARQHVLHETGRLKSDTA